MATWRAKCWLGSETGYQYLEVQSETLNGAYVQFENIYGVTDPINVEEIGGGYSGGSSGLGGLAVLAIGGWLAWEIWFCHCNGCLEMVRGIVSIHDTTTFCGSCSRILLSCSYSRCT